MLITLTKTEKIQHEVDVKFPSYYADKIRIEYWMLCSEKKAIQVFHFSGSKQLIVHANLASDVVYKIITEHEPISAEVFKQAMIKVAEEAECYSAENEPI